MTIEAAVAILTGIIAITTTFLTLFVNNKIATSEDRMMERIAALYMSRELVAEKFRQLHFRIDDLVSAVRPPKNDTPKHPFLGEIGDDD